jgi:CubicO group peptidase (beta-lactamase class C family)
MKRLLSFALLLALLMLFLPEGYVRASTSDYSATAAKISALIGKKMAEEQIVGMSVALGDGQEVVWAQGFGYADKEKGMKAGPGTFYEIGSCSKTLAALAIMTLVEKGLVDLDRPIEEYLPKFSIRQRFPQSGPITLRTIMTHHSGIPGDLYHGSFDYKYHPEVYDRILELLRDEFTAFPANFVWAYSNTAVTLEGAIVEAVTKQSFLDYGDALLRKIGMNESSWILRSTFADRRARGYIKGNPVPDYYISIAPAGSILSSVLEMAEYIKMMLAGGGGVVKPETIEKMITRQNGDVPLDVFYS